MEKWEWLHFPSLNFLSSSFLWFVLYLVCYFLSYREKERVCSCACGQVCVCVAWRCSVIVDKSTSPPVVRADIVVSFPWQTSHSSLKLDVQKWFYFSIEWQVSNLLDAVGDINPVIFTVVNIAWRHVIWIVMIE